MTEKCGLFSEKIPLQVWLQVMYVQSFELDWLFHFLWAARLDVEVEALQIEDQNLH